MQNLMKEQKQQPVDFLLYIYFALVAKNHQKIHSRCLVHEFTFTFIF